MKLSSWHISASCSHDMDVFSSSVPTAGLFLLLVFGWCSSLVTWAEQVTNSLAIGQFLLFTKCYRTDQIIGQHGMLSSVNPTADVTPPNPLSVEGNKKKERTVKSDRNSVYGAPERSCLLELLMEVHVTCKATSCWTYSGICQMVF